MVGTMIKNGVMLYTKFTKKNTQKRALPSLKSRWKNLKCDFGFYHYMANRSGCSWNEDAHMPDVPEDAWNHLQQKDTNRYKKYFNKPFPWYKRVEVLYGKGIAVGRSHITTDPNCSIPRTFMEASSSDDDKATQQETNDFNLPESRVNVGGVETIPEPVVESFYENIPTGTVPSSQNRKSGNSIAGEPSRRTKKQNINRMDEFAERFLYQQKQRNELIAELGQSNRVHDQALNKLQSLALPADVHVDMEMSLGNSWIRGCFIKEEDNERLMMIINRAVGLFRSGQLPINS